MLLDMGFDKEARDEENNTPLCSALFYQQPDTSALLVARGCSPKAQNCLGYTPLHFAARVGYREVIVIVVMIVIVMMTYYFTTNTTNTNTTTTTRW